MLTLREITQCLLSFRNYFKSRMNWFEMTLIVLSSLVLFGDFDEEFQRVLRAMTILCASTEFLFLAGTTPSFSISTHMVILRTVIVTFMKSIAFYAILLIGFALCFFTLFGDDPSSPTKKGLEGNSTNIASQTSKDGEEEKQHSNFFYHPGIALIKTLVMLTGNYQLRVLEINFASN